MIRKLLRNVLVTSMLFLLLGNFTACSKGAQSEDDQDEPIACNSTDDFTDSSTLSDCWVVGNDEATQMTVFEIDSGNSWFIMDDPARAPFNNGSPAISKDSESGDLTVTLKIADMTETADDGLLFGLDGDMGKYVYFYLLGGRCLVTSNTASNVVPLMDCNTQERYPFYMRIEKKGDNYNFYYKASESNDYILLNDGTENNQDQDWAGPEFTSEYRVLIAPIVGGSSREYVAKIDSLTFDVGNAVGQN